jgi:hypothetical protein
LRGRCTAALLPLLLLDAAAAGSRGSGIALNAMKGMKKTLVMNMMAVNHTPCGTQQQQQQ